MMPPDVRRVIAVVLDGLRPDAVDAFDMTMLRALSSHGASTMRARTVSPPLTWPALTSFLTGVAPDRHGIMGDSTHIPRPRTAMAPLPELLMRGGFPSSAFLGDVPRLYRIFAHRVAERAGFGRARFGGANALEVLQAARPLLEAQRRGLVFMHWTDADVAGHAHGWMSPEYGHAARQLDTALGKLISTADVHTDPHTALVVFADHGGGGVAPDHHEGDHPLNTTIPVVISGAAVRRVEMADVSLLDLPPTIAWSLGVRADASYAGRVLSEAFVTPAADADDARLPAAADASRLECYTSSATPIASSWPMSTSPG